MPATTVNRGKSNERISMLKVKTIRNDSARTFCGLLKSGVFGITRTSATARSWATASAGLSELGRRVWSLIISMPMPQTNDMTSVGKMKTILG